VTKPAWVQLMRWLTLVTVVTVSVVFVGGTLAWLAERDAPGSNLRHWGDCVWWAVTTLATVGYGEHFPVTLRGRLVAVVIMAIGVAVIGAVAAVVAFAFASRLTTRIEAAVQHMETQVEQVEAEMETVSERMDDDRRPRGGSGPRTGLRELVIGVADRETAGSLTWLLARLGWHPEAGDTGVAWRDGGVVLRVAVRPWDTPFGVQGRLTFGAGSPERLARIAREATGHGFHRVTTRAQALAAAESLPEHAESPPDGRANGRADGLPVTLRAVSGFEVVLVTS